MILEAYTIRHWLSHGIDYTKVPRAAALPSNPYVSPLSPTRQFLPSLCLRTRRSFPWISVAKGLYRAPSNLPELLVVMLCKRPHFVTIAPAGGRPPPPRYASQRGAEKLKSTLLLVESPPVCSCTAYPSHPSSTFSRLDKIVPYVSAVHFRNYADDVLPSVRACTSFPAKI